MGKNTVKREIESDARTASSCDLSTGGMHNDDCAREVGVETIEAGTEIVLVNEADEDLEEDLYMIKLLSRKAMHLPHGSWCQDWISFMKNNHPVFGIFLHHQLHPLKVEHRLYILLASFAFGLTATNAVYLYNAFNNEEMSQVLIQVALKDNATLNIKQIEALEVTYGVLFLWTVGGAMHAGFDITMWYFSACACFNSGASCSNQNNRKRCQKAGSYIVLAFTGVLMASGVFFVLMRAIYDVRLRAAGEGEELGDLEWRELHRVQNFSFLIGYLVELVLAYLAYYPLIITVLFTGIFPWIGRPKEMRKQLRERRAREKKYRVEHGYI